jgi:predicted TIM-barrel fold metal-dependent hydrolase
MLVQGVRPQTEADAALVREIARIKMIDNHSPDLPAGTSRLEKWSPADPLGSPPYPAVVRLRVDNPEWVGAWRALYGYKYSDLKPEHTRPLLQTKMRLMREKGDAYPAWVLDRAGIETAFVNDSALGSGLKQPRFRLVPYASPFISPFPVKSALKQLLADLKFAVPPASLDAYLKSVVTATLERWKREGVPAVKFTTAYSRTLEFADVPEAFAARIYERSAAGDESTPAAATALQDFLFRYICREAGRLGLAVHIHTGNGTGPHFTNSRANPALLESVLDDPAMRGTNFVLVHGGWPFEKIAGAMLDKPNTYADFSAQTFYLYPRALSDVLRGWLEWQPEKVLFGSDAYSDDNTPLADWEEKAWLTAAVSRRALAIALTGMMNDGEITRPRAIEIARMVLRDNARRLYKLD